MEAAEIVAEDELGTAQEPDLDFEYLQGLCPRSEREPVIAAAELEFAWECGATSEQTVGLEFAPELEAEPGPGLGAAPRAALERAPGPGLETEPGTWRAELREGPRRQQEPRAGSGPRAGAEPPRAGPGPGAAPAPRARPLLEAPAEPAWLPPHL